MCWSWTKPSVEKVDSEALENESQLERQKMIADLEIARVRIQQALKPGKKLGSLNLALEYSNEGTFVIMKTVVIHWSCWFITWASEIEARSLVDGLEFDFSGHVNQVTVMTLADGVFQ